MRLWKANKEYCSKIEVSISDEKPLHMRQVWNIGNIGILAQFQSQTRSRSTCDDQNNFYCLVISDVSISDEKPLHMRLTGDAASSKRPCRFNLRREAAPHATQLRSAYKRATNGFQSQTRSRSTCDSLLQKLVTQVL